MNSDDLQVFQLEDSTDARGISFSLQAAELGLLPSIQDVHLAAINPGCTRGNHYHRRRTELITVVYQGPWSLHWDTGPNTISRHRDFEGTGAVALAPPSEWSHAVRNDGDGEMWVFVASDRPYDPSDVISRVVTN